MTASLSRVSSWELLFHWKRFFNTHPCGNVFVLPPPVRRIASDGNKPREKERERERERK